MGLSLAAQGRLEESLAELKRVQELDPVSLIAHAESARILYLSGKYDKAIDAASQALELDPWFMRARIRLGEAYWMKGMLPQAIDELKRAVEISDSDVPRATLGAAYAEAGDLTAARRLLVELLNRGNGTPVSPYSLAVLYAALGESEPLFASLERAYQDRASALIYILVEPRFKRYHSDSRFRAILRRMGLESPLENTYAYL